MPVHTPTTCMTPRIPTRSPARRELQIMMGLVIVVHAIAIAIYRLADIEHRPPSTLRLFGGIWTAVTVVIVGLGLRRVRLARSRRRGAR